MAQYNFGLEIVSNFSWNSQCKVILIGLGIRIRDSPIQFVSNQFNILIFLGNVFHGDPEVHVRVHSHVHCSMILIQLDSIPEGAFNSDAAQESHLKAEYLVLIKKIV